MAWKDGLGLKEPEVIRVLLKLQDSRMYYYIRGKHHAVAKGGRVGKGG